MYPPLNQRLRFCVLCLLLFGSAAPAVALDGNEKGIEGVQEITEGGFAVNCPVDSFYSQVPLPPSGPWAFFTSDQNSAFLVHDDYSGVGQPICGFAWWGILQDSGQGGACMERLQGFEINFYEDDSGVPGSLVCSFPVLVTPLEMGVNYSGFGDLLGFGASFPELLCCNLPMGWISIQHFGPDPECLFLWASSTAEFAGTALQDDGISLNQLNRDMSLCLSDPPNPPTVGDDTCYTGTIDLGTPCAGGSCSGTSFLGDDFAFLPIPDNGGPGNPAISTIVVPESFLLGDVDVELFIQHTFVGDLTVTLEHDGTTVTLIDRPLSGTGNCSSDDYAVSLDDAGTGGSIQGICGPDTDALTPTSPPDYTPKEALSAFDGMDAAGDWTLAVSDNAAPETGTLLFWLLESSSPAGICGSKGRYITAKFSATGNQSIQVRIVDIADAVGTDERQAEVWWGGPSQVIPNAPNTDLTGVPLVCEPTPSHTETWPGGDLHLFGAPVVPGSLYEVSLCDETGLICSEPLRVSTGEWGDVVAPFGGGSQPNFSDISSVVDKFRILASAPDVPRADLAGPGNPGAPNEPNQGVNFTDISLDVDAFRGFAYPFIVPACP